MARAPYVSCNAGCSGCPVLPLTREQYRCIVNQALNDPNPDDKELARKMLNMEVYAVFCVQKQQTCVLHVNKDP
jgi:hypothetical protein